MLYTINTGNQATIKWGAKGEERILQNVINLINTFTYEIAYGRTIGISRDFIDLPTPQSAAAATNDLIELISLREPRAKVESVEAMGVDKSGNIILQVVIEI